MNGHESPTLCDLLLDLADQYLGEDCLLLVERMVDETQQLQAAARAADPRSSIVRLVHHENLQSLHAGSGSLPASEFLIRPLPGTALAMPPNSLRWSADVAGHFVVRIDGCRQGSHWEVESDEPQVAWPNLALLEPGEDCLWQVQCDTPLDGCAAGMTMTAARETRDPALVCRGWFSMLPADLAGNWQSRRSQLDGPEQPVATRLMLAFVAIEYELFDEALTQLDRIAGGPVTASEAAVVAQVYRTLYRRMEERLASCGHRMESDLAQHAANEHLVRSVCHMLGATEIRAAGQCATCGKCGLVTTQ
jgi:hypothetical protein